MEKQDKKKAEIEIIDSENAKQHKGICKGRYGGSGKTIIIK